MELTPLRNRKPETDTLSNSEDSDEMPHNVTFP